MHIHRKGHGRREAMGQDPVWKLLFRFSGPAIVSMTVASSYNLVDAIFVGRLGQEALAAMGVTFPLVLSFVAIATGTGVGATSLISRSLGAGDHERADRAAGAAMSLCFLLGGLIALLTLPNLDTILRLLGAGDAVLPLAESYMSILIRFLVFSFLVHIMANIVRAEGNPVFASAVSISSAILNVILDPVFIFGFGPVPAMGISGAAIATVIAQATGMAVYLVHIVSGRTGYRFRPGYFLPRPDIVAGIYRVGMASIVRSGVQFVVMGLVNRTAASFGVMPLAIMGVLMRSGRFVQMPILGLGQGMLPLVGYNYGARKKERLAEIVFKTGLAGFAWTGLLWMLIMLFPAEVISLFSGEAVFQSEGAEAIRLYSLVYFALGVQMVPSFFFQGIGKGLPATVLSAARQFLFLLPALLVMPRFFGLTGVWLAFPIADALALLLGLFWLRIEFRRQGLSFCWRPPI
ncbi:MAG: MATE family efflux transporter [Chloroflexi bacterium]|nr:MATE family efflux transporter [Chloroflexota bacterium]